MKCVVDEAAKALTSCTRDLRAAKKGGEWSKGDKKALKKEAKGLFKGVKRDVKSMWKNKE